VLCFVVSRCLGWKHRIGICPIQTLGCSYLIDCSASVNYLAFHKAGIRQEFGGWELPRGLRPVGIKTGLKFSAGVSAGLVRSSPSRVASAYRLRRWRISSIQWEVPNVARGAAGNYQILITPKIPIPQTAHLVSTLTPELDWPASDQQEVSHPALLISNARCGLVTPTTRAYQSIVPPHPITLVQI